MLGTLLMLILVLVPRGVFPRWSHSLAWGYVPTGSVGLALIVVIVLLLIGRI